jgi:hypothetical protein
MNKTLLVDGHAAVTTSDQGKVVGFQFLPDDQDRQLIDGGQASGTAQLMRNASFDFVVSPKRQRANSTLIRKAAHGRISATRDQAVQLTLKVFRREGLDINETMRHDFNDLMNNVKL